MNFDDDSIRVAAEELDGMALAIGGLVAVLGILVAIIACL